MQVTPPEGETRCEETHSIVKYWVIYIYISTLQYSCPLVTMPIFQSTQIGSLFQHNVDQRNSMFVDEGNHNATAVGFNPNIVTYQYIIIYCYVN